MGKFENLKFLRDNGFNVPDFIVYEDEETLKNFLSCCKENELFAIRSSANLEDGEDNSFAGIFDSYVGINNTEIEKYYNMVKESINSEIVKSYCVKKGIDKNDIKMDVIIQKFIKFEVSGVCFTKNREQANIEVIYGDLFNLVEGNVTPDKIDINLINGDCQYNVGHQKYKTIAGKEEILFLDASRKKLTDYNLKQLVECITEVINCYNKDIDMEFGYNDGELYIVQVRDVTADF